MKQAQVQVKEKDSVPSMGEMQASLKRLERREWWRWTTALFIMLLLTLGVFALSLPGMKKDGFSRYELDMAVPGLLGMVLVFVFFAIYQQFRITHLRRQLAGQIGMMAALEVLKPPTPDEHKGRSERRRAPRLPFDQRLTVKAAIDGNVETFYGRIIDISEFGLGAVISGALERGQQVSLEFGMGAGQPPLQLTAMIRYARGFRHGFEFSNLTAHESEHLKQACQTVLGIEVA